MKLLVVESPGIVKALRGILQRYERDNWNVVATGGQWRILPPMKDGCAFEDSIDVGDRFRERWILDASKQEAVDRLAGAIASADEVLLAINPGREGEAAAWHICEHFGLKSPHRVLLGSISYQDVVDAIESARWVSSMLVDAQRARAVVDYLVGMEVSRLLWRVGAKGIGRLQGCILRLIVDREGEIGRSQDPEIRTVCFDYSTGGIEWTLRHCWELDKDFQKRFQESLRSTEETARTREPEVSVLAELARGYPHVVAAIETQVVTEKPPLPMTTARMLCVAADRYGMSVRTCTTAAQRLFERGLITSPRTDCTYLSEETTTAVRAYLGARWPLLFPEQPVRSPRRRNADGGQEAVRPTAMTVAPKDELPLDGNLLYQIIFEQTLLSQARPSVYDLATVTIDLDGADRQLVGRHRFVKQAGWQQLDEAWEPPEQEAIPIAVGDRLAPRDVVVWDDESASSQRYTEASLIEYMEKQHLGKASTYVQILEMLVQRGYVVQRDGVLLPTELGMQVDAVLRAGFDELFREDFTGKTEVCFDAIAGGRLGRVRFLEKFYERFQQMKEEAEAAIEKRRSA